MARLPITTGRGKTLRQVAEALVDDDVLEWASRYRWHVMPSGYVFRNAYDRATRRVRKVRLHREIMAPSDGMEVDHRNRDPLDNRRANLRICTHAENRQNNAAEGRGSSRYRGVTWDAARGKWKAQVKLNYRTHVLGRFDAEEDAAEAARTFRAEHMSHATN